MTLISLYETLNQLVVVVYESGFGPFQKVPVYCLIKVYNSI